MTSLKNICSNMTKAVSHMRIIIATFEEDESIDNKYINELIKCHPTKQIDNIEWLKMKTRTPYNKLALYYKNSITGVVDDISWKLCIRNLYGKWIPSKEYIADVMNAFRYDSYKGSTRKYKTNNTLKRMGICDDCKIITYDITVDHYPLPFKSIIDTFIKDNNITLSKIEYNETDNNALILKDRELSNHWLEYHDSVATYRLLCKSCNCKCGSYGF